MPPHRIVQVQFLSSGNQTKSKDTNSRLRLYSVEKPSVQCSFITEFEDHIFVTVDADAFFFLHDLITSYVKEKEKMVNIWKLLF